MPPCVCSITSYCEVPGFYSMILMQKFTCCNMQLARSCIQRRRVSSGQQAQIIPLTNFPLHISCISGRFHHCHCKNSLSDVVFKSKTVFYCLQSKATIGLKRISPSNSLQNIHRLHEKGIIDTSSRQKVKTQERCFFVSN